MEKTCSKNISERWHKHKKKGTGLDVVETGTVREKQRLAKKISQDYFFAAQRNNTFKLSHKQIKIHIFFLTIADHQIVLRITSHGI